VAAEAPYRPGFAVLPTDYVIYIDKKSFPAHSRHRSKPVYRPSDDRVSTANCMT
jgi:hypothetical protein